MPQNLPAPSLSPLAPHFVGPKPIEDAPDSLFQELEDAGQLAILRKLNGWGIYTTTTGRSKQSVAFYTRGIDDVTPKFRALQDEVRSINTHGCTLLLTEMYTKVGGIDSLGDFVSIVKSNPDRAAEIQKEQPVKLGVFNVLVHKGKSVAHLPYDDRLDIVQNLLAKHQGPHVHAVTPLDVSFESAKKLSIDKKWEGLVLYDLRAGTEYRVGEKVTIPRPYGCWKRKEYSEGDFVATGYVPSIKRPGAVKDFLIGQYNPTTGLFEDWGKCSTGISVAERYLYADPSKYPLVLEIKYERLTINRKLFLAQILRIRFDKKPEECFSPVNWQAALAA